MGLVLHCVIPTYPNASKDCTLLPPVNGKRGAGLYALRPPPVKDGQASSRQQNIDTQLSPEIIGLIFGNLARSMWQIEPTASHPLHKRNITRKSTNDVPKRNSGSAPAPFIPLRKLMWGDAERKQSREEQEARDNASDLIQTTNRDLTLTRAELVFFLGTLLFVAITTLSITDRDLLFGSNVRLPILALSINFSAFLLGAPLLILVVHYALLFKFAIIRDKCRVISHFIRNNGGDDTKTTKLLALMATTNFTAQWLVADTGNAFYRHMSAVIYFLSIWLAPIFVLLLVTIRTLPLHQPWLTYPQIVTLSLDAALLALFHGTLRHRTRRFFIIGLTTWLAASLILCIPDSRFDVIGRTLWPASVPFGSADGSRTAFAPTAFFLENGLNHATGRPIMFFSRNLIVTDDQRRGRTSDKPNFRGRDLRYAILDRSNLRNADFTDADLSGASLVGADLRNATFGCTLKNENIFADLWDSVWYSLLQSWSSLLHYRRTSFGYWTSYPVSCTTMAATRFDLADLRNTKFVEAQDQKPSLVGAQLSHANLDGVDLSFMNLSMADLANAKLVGANLTYTTLIGTILSDADLTGADLEGASMQLAALPNTQLNGANLIHTLLVAADFSKAQLIGTNLAGAILYGADFDKAMLWGSTPPPKQDFAWTDFTGARVQPPSKSMVASINTSLSRMSSSIRNSNRIRRLETLLSAKSDSSYISVQSQAWKKLIEILSRDRADTSFRNAVSDLITENACQNAEVAQAVYAWAKPDYDYDGTSYSTPIRTVPAPLPDPALKYATTAIAKFDLYGSYSLYTDYYYTPARPPLPSWYDLGPLIGKLEGGKCFANKRIPPGLVAALKNANKLRRAHLAKLAR